MYTGLQLATDFAIRINQTRAAGFLSEAREKDCLRVGLIKAIEKRYQSITTQSSVDEISPLIKTYTPFYPYNNQVLLKPLHIVSIANPSGNIYQIVFDRPHNIDFTTFPTVDIVFSGIEGGTYTILNGEVFSASADASLPLTAVRITALGLSGTYTLNTGQATGDYWLSDYYHFLAAKVVSKKDTRVTIKSVILNSLPAKTILVGTNNFRDGEKLYFSGFGGLTGLSGDKYIKKIGDWKIAIYNDVNLTVPATITGTYTSGGTISRYFTKSVQPLVSDQDIDSFGATEIFPLYQTNSNKLVCYTSERNLSPYITQESYLVDYITTKAEIDTTDDTTDLLETYNMTMINSIIEESAIEFYKIVSNETNIKIAQIAQ